MVEEVDTVLKLRCNKSNGGADLPSIRITLSMLLDAVGCQRDRHRVIRRLRRSAIVLRMKLDGQRLGVHDHPRLPARALPVNAEYPHRR